MCTASTGRTHERTRRRHHCRKLLRRWGHDEQDDQQVSSEVHERAVRMVLYHTGEHPSHWTAVVSIAEKIGCSAQTLHEWVKKAEIDGGTRAGLPTAVAEKLNALER
jgi:transposase-like protein